MCNISTIQWQYTSLNTENEWSDKSFVIIRWLTFGQREVDNSFCTTNALQHSMSDFSRSYAHVSRSCCSHLLSSASPSDGWGFLALRNTSVQLTALLRSRSFSTDRASFFCLSSSSFDNGLPDCSCSFMDSSTEICAWILDRSSSAVLRWLTRLIEMEVKAIANKAWGK